MAPKRIAVIGAGAAGVCVARHLKSLDNVLFNVFEKSKGIGGVWRYTDKIDFDDHGLRIHSAMYKDMKTNLPKQTIEFPDFPFNKAVPTFMHHSKVLKYLESYCEHYQLYPHIKFEISVANVIPVNDNLEKWKIQYHDLKKNQVCTDIYDAIFVCNGHYAIPNLPVFKNEELFHGSIIHSHSFRKNVDYTNKNVVILGGRASGIDIGLDIALVAKHVCISHRTNRLAEPLPSNVSQTQVISKFHEDGKTIEFDNGSKFEADAVVYCTGYKYEFPFLDEKCDIKVSNNRITWLYNHIINAKHPSMAFIGICARNAPLPQFHCQAQYAILATLGMLKLPSQKKMIAEILNDYNARIQRGMKPSDAHVMDDLQWPYNDELADLAGVNRIPKHVQELYWLARTRRKNCLTTYKNENYKIINGKYELDK